MCDLDDMQHWSNVRCDCSCDLRTKFVGSKTCAMKFTSAGFVFAVAFVLLLEALACII